MHWVFTQTEISNYFYYLKFQTIQNTTQSHQHIINIHNCLKSTTIATNISVPISAGKNS